MMQYRKALLNDVPALAVIRSTDWETPEYWQTRIAGYLNGELHPQHALPPRVIFLAMKDELVTGFVAGHLTRRFDCAGELQWISVLPAYRRTGTADELLRVAAQWFVDQKALHVCVNSDAEDATAHRFYKRNGAEDLTLHWMAWNDISTVLKK